MIYKKNARFVGGNSIGHVIFRVCVCGVLSLITLYNRVSDRHTQKTLAIYIYIYIIMNLCYQSPSQSLRKKTNIIYIYIKPRCGQFEANVLSPDAADHHHHPMWLGGPRKFYGYYFCAFHERNTNCFYLGKPLSATYLILGLEINV